MTTITVDDIQGDLLGYLRRIQAGLLVVLDDFDGPLPEEILRLFKGE